MEYNSSSETFAYFLCSNCGTVRNYNPPSERVLSDYYPDEYGAYHLESNRLSFLLSRLNAILLGVEKCYYGIPIDTDSHSSSNILDIGCGGGNLASLLQNIGHKVIGVDASDRAIQESKNKGIECVKGDTAHVPFIDQTFDVLISSQNLEHLYSPSTALENYNRLLRASGKIIIATPNADSLVHKLFGKYWFGGISAPRHLTIPSMRGLKDSLDRHGFNVILSRTTFYPSFGRSLFLKISRNYDRAKKSIFLGLLFVPLDIFFTLIGKGDGLALVSVKKPSNFHRH